uniref:Uncharacterized protein n=1 Tax=Micrurus lemniscatus lemniscatus TaxID=129467 RepID=A0A2D4JED3_MICLE
MLERHQNVQKVHFINTHFQKIKHLNFQYSVLIQTHEFIYLNLDRETAVPISDSLILVQTGENHARLGFWRKERSFLYRCCLFRGCTRHTFICRDESSCPVDIRASLVHHHQLDWLLGFHGNLQNTLLTGIFPSTVIEHARNQENQKQDHVASNQNDQVQGHGVKL